MTTMNLVQLVKASGQLNFQAGRLSLSGRKNTDMHHLKFLRHCSQDYGME